MEGAVSLSEHQGNGVAATEAETSQGNGDRVISVGVENVITQFPGATPPEMMRAAEKDEHYSTHLCEACYDAFRSAFGTRLAVAYQNELKLAGRVLYYLLTTGAGLQTLGEEYCDIIQVVGPYGLPVSPARRTMLFFYQTVLPYLSERLSARASARGHLLAMEIERNDENSSQRGESSISGDPGPETQNSEDDRENANRATTSNQLSTTGRFRQICMGALQGWPLVLPSVRDAMMLITRAHLMVYYFEGLYYHIGKRAASIRYSFMGRPSQQRPGYHILGLFLFFQLSFVCGEWLSRTIVPAIASSMQSRAAQHHSSHTGSRGISVLDEDGHNILNKCNIQPSSSWTDSEGPVPSKCPLCLSPRQHPTATPCGHVFCWTCVAEWCNEKPECPLCRASVSHPELVGVYHADF